MKKDLYIVCHVLSSIDGRIDGSMFTKEEIEMSKPYYEDIYKNYNAQATMAGTVTCATTFASGYIKELPYSNKQYKREDRIHNLGLNKFFVCIDAFGTLKFESNTVMSHGEKGEIVVALTRNVSNNYIDYLESLHISYLFAGDDKLDILELVTKIETVLGVKKCLVTGGGVLNWSLLQLGLIDELSIVVTPVVGGERNEPTLFDRSMFQEDDKAIGFELEDIKKLDKNNIWITYKPNYD